MVAEKALRRLSRKEEVFARLVVAGKNFAEAYREAYSSDSPNAKINGRRVSLRPHVRARIEDLQKPDEKRLFASRAYKRELLYNMMQNVRLDALERQRALDLDNKMDGTYKTIVQVEGEITLVSVMAALNGSSPLPAEDEAIEVQSFQLPAGPKGGDDSRSSELKAVTVDETIAVRDAGGETATPPAPPVGQKRTPGPFEEDFDAFPVPEENPPKKRRTRVYPA
jgi:hypothetical protein